eukprot:sb/3477118/
MSNIHLLSKSPVTQQIFTHGRASLASGSLATLTTCGRPKVIGTLYALSSVASTNGYQGPGIGVKIAEENVREFDEATLNAGKSILGGQMGWTEGANQSGMNIGNCRHIVD